MLYLKGINNELKTTRLHRLYTFLNNVISILVLHTFQNIAVKFLQ